MFNQRLLIAFLFLCFYLNHSSIAFLMNSIIKKIMQKIIKGFPMQNLHLRKYMFIQKIIRNTIKSQTERDKRCVIDHIYFSYGNVWLYFYVAQNITFSLLLLLLSMFFSFFEHTTFSLRVCSVGCWLLVKGWKVKVQFIFISCFFLVPKHNFCWLLLLLPQSFFLW